MNWADYALLAYLGIGFVLAAILHGEPVAATKYNLGWTLVRCLIIGGLAYCGGMFSS